ncbi:hypothetical protein Pcinc_021176 [Petrolisthes cinctipes]|uniref:Ionotropic glutamate receptor C-terminal domain-containing protein n=1 Tax=Petrolisthes cinctipes TaxID=88211 RepID=A0AAE1FI43_PETCI|nr:hypothetical protein Pcinc_021176 [Petrolisthes cinctipes]
MPGMDSGCLLAMTWLLASLVFMTINHTSSHFQYMSLGSHWLPRMDSGRLLVLTWLLASLVFMTSYSGILTSMLTVPRVTIPIDSISDLVAQSDLSWRLEAGTMMFNILGVS